VDLKRKARLFHVPAWVHIIQGILLFTSTIKDAITAYLVSNMVKNQFDWFTMKPRDNEKTLTEQVIFLAGFIFEDIGQVLLQYIFYEQFMTKPSIFSIVNATIMALSAIPKLYLVLKYKIRESKDVLLKVFLIVFYAYPAFLLCLLRLKEKGCLILQISS